MQKTDKQSGFTLIEVMLAMTLLSIMVALLFGSLKICAESWNKGEAKIAEVNEKAVVYQFFKRHLPSVRPLWDDFSDEGDRWFSFQGTRNKLQFVSVFPSSAGRKGFQLFEIKFEHQDEGQIKVILSPFYPSLDGEQWEAEEVVLLEHVKSFKISYFAKETTDSNGVWVDNWQEKQNLPSLVKIKIELNTPSFWPEMIFAFKVSSIQPEFQLGEN